MSEISPTELGARLFESDASPVVLDIRHPQDFEDWHIPGSTNVDLYDTVQEDPDAAARAFADLPRDREIVTVCAAGVVSQQVTDLLLEDGYDAKTLVDGMRGWSRVHLSAPVEGGIDGRLIQIARPGKGCLSYVLVSQGKAAVFDPSHYPAEYERHIDADVDLVGVFDTHAHADHVSGGRDLAARNDVPYHLHPADATGIDASAVTDGQVVSVGAVDVEVIHTPGHSPGGVTYAIGNAALLTGDTLFHESVGRVELGVEAGIEETDVAANAATLYESIRRLRRRDGNPLVLPAHDPGTPVPPVTARLREVEADNDDLELAREAFVSALADDVPDHPPNFQRVKRANTGIESIDEGEIASLEAGPNRCAAD